MISKKIQSLAIALVFGSLSFASAGDIFVKAKSGEIKKDPRGTSKTVTKVKFGAKLANAKKSSRWYKVKYRGKSGYIYKGFISKKAPEKDPSLTAKDGSALSSEEVDASSAVRGVGPNATKFADRGGIKDVHRTYIDYHQSFVFSDTPITAEGVKKQYITTAEIENFMKDAKLGPYGE
ncbi:MAG: hypothetical protein P1V97_35420 [Planctomycetota bacterium]|nr:hypothetical protein [Planctomycetota bacterium]